MNRPDVERYELEARTDDFDWGYENGGMAPDTVLELIAYIHHLEKLAGVKVEGLKPIRFFGGDSDGVVSTLPWRSYAKLDKDAYRSAEFATVTKGPDEPIEEGDTVKCMVVARYDRKTHRLEPRPSVVADIEDTLAGLAIMAALPLTA